VDYLFTISPVVVPLVGVDEMSRFEAVFRQAASPTSPSPPDGDDDGSVFEEAVDDGEGDLP
jgi:hypothetical protein